MWPWQRNGEQPSHTLVRRLLFLSTVGHIGVLMLLFVFYHDTNNVSRDVIAVLLDMDVTVVKMPLTKVMHKSAPVIGSGNRTVAQAQAPAIKAAPPETGLSKPKEPKIAIAKAKKPEKSKKEAKAKKEKPKEKPKPPQLAKTEPKKVEEKKPEPPQPVIAQAVAVQNVEPVTDQVISNEQLVVGENVVYVGQHEYEALEVQRQIQQEAQRCWKAPPGVRADVACQIVAHIDHEGKIRELLIAKESGVLMFDVRARQAVSQMEFPRGSWGKEVVVYFKQS
jgi:outer membrane biosynthesis protein TonB